MIIIYIAGIILYLFLMKEIILALIAHVIPENKKYIPAWIILSLLSIMGGVLLYPILNEFKTPLFYVFTLAMFALWAQIFIIFSSADAKRQHKQTQIEKMLHWNETQKAIMREFWIQTGNIAKIPLQEGIVITDLIEDGFIKKIGEEQLGNFVVFLSNIEVKINLEEA